MEFMISAKTDIGLTREKNQDSYVVRRYRMTQGDVIFAMVCDGMGGLADGEIASGTLVRAFCQWADRRLSILCGNDMLEQELWREWLQVTKEWNERLQKYSERRGRKLGSTLTAILITSQRYYIFHVGDTRVYEIGDEVALLTRDQTVTAREVALGRLTEEQEKEDGRKHILLQCVGASKVVHPEWVCGETKKGYVYLLCSDGFWHMATKVELLELWEVGKERDSDALKGSLENIIWKNKERMERDNMTVIAIAAF